MKVPTIYSGTYGYRDCDSIARVYGRTPDEFETRMDEALTEELDRSRDTCEGHDGDVDALEDCDMCNPDLWYVGPFAMSLLEACRDEKREYGRFGATDLIDTFRVSYITPVDVA